MAKAIWNGVTIAESDDIALVEGNAYFPMAAVNQDYLRKSVDTKQTFCHWKGFASYFDVVVDGDENVAAAWTYEAPYEESMVIDERIAFWKGVEILDKPEGIGLIEIEPSQRGERSGWEALCWLMRSQRDIEGGVMSAQFIRDNTDLDGGALQAAWQESYVQHYAARYKWRLEGDPAQLEKTE
ncbi:MAG: DUF427 domain-containing protein [Rhodospirillales bacterium]|nr:DUF427 domain-containing protein [Rhodospirillales bacterium]